MHRSRLLPSLSRCCTDNSWGPCFIDECFANFRGPGEAIGVHSGATPPIARNAYAYRSWGGDHAGSRFMSMQLNVLIALTDIGPGDGGTMLIPASHKASLPHPQIIGRTEALAKPGATADNVPGAAHTDEVTAAVEMFMEAGDALLFSDATVSGPALLPLRPLSFSASSPALSSLQDVLKFCVICVLTRHFVACAGARLRQADQRWREARGGLPLPAQLGQLPHPLRGLP